MISKNKIVNILEKVLKKNAFIYDVWIYGSYKDKISDIDLIIVYDGKIKKIRIPKFIKNKLYGGTIIYIPKKNSKNIFLFEKLKIFSIKKKRYLNDSIQKKYLIYRSLTSFLERYYERRLKYKSIKNSNFTNRDLRNMKSILFSYNAFYDFCKIKKIKIKKQNYLKKYLNLRSKLIDKKISKKNFTIFIKEIKKFDKSFFKKSFFILEKIYKKTPLVAYNYKFTKNIKFKYNKNNKFNYNNTPKILGLMYDFYVNQNFEISKKISKDFKTVNKAKLNSLGKDFQNYLIKKITFLNQSYIDLKKAKLKKGMYRLTWYLE